MFFGIKFTNKAVVGTVVLLAIGPFRELTSYQ